MTTGVDFYGIKISWSPIFLGAGSAEVRWVSRNPKRPVSAAHAEPGRPYLFRSNNGDSSVACLGGILRYSCVAPISES